MLKFVFKANWISLELLHKDGNIERDDCVLISFDYYNNLKTCFWFNMSLVSLSLSLFRHWSSHHAGLCLWRGAHLTVP